MAGIAWIPGGSSGIGLAAARELAKAGWTVVLSGRREAALAEACATIRQEGGIADSEVLDVCDAAAVAAAHAAIVARHGGIPLLINSAGHNIAHRDWDEVSPQDFDGTITANLNGSFYAIRAVLPEMRRRQSGLIINIVSYAGRHVSPGAGPAYTAAKHAVFAMTAQLNMAEVANGIRACALCPGEVDTPIMLARKTVPSEAERARMLKADDMGRLIRFLVELPPSMLVSELVVAPTGRN